MFTLRKSMAVLGAAAMLVSFAACGSNGSSSAANAKSTVTVWGWDTTLATVAKDFMKKNPNITVKVQNVGTSAKTQMALNNAIQAGKGAPMCR